MSGWVERLTGPSTYSSTTGYIQLPGFSARDRRDIPNPDGSLNPSNPLAKYGLEWISKEQIQRIRLQTNDVYRFACDVSALSGQSLDKIWRGGDDPGKVLDNMLLSTISTELLEVNRNADINTEEMSSVLQDFFKDSSSHLREMFGSTALQHEGDNEFFNQAMQDFIKHEQERKKAKEAQKSKGDGPVSTPNPAGRHTSLPTAGPRTVVSDVEGPARPVRITFIDPPPASETEPPVPQPAPALSPEEAARERERMRIQVLFYLLSKGTNDATLKVIDMLFNPAINKDRQELRAAYLKDIQTLRSLLKSTSAQTANGWLDAPHHIGLIFFSSNFTGAINDAMRLLRNVCGKQDIPVIDLMVHGRVKSDFAQLVSYYINQARTDSVSRWGGSDAIIERRRHAQDGRIRLFKKLKYMQDGFLGFEGISQIDKDTERQKKERDREAYVSSNGHYFGGSMTEY